MKDDVAGLNRLTSVPAELGSLTGLKGMVLSSNQLTSVPAELWRLTVLTLLYFEENERLPSLPAELEDGGVLVTSAVPHHEHQRRDAAQERALTRAAVAPRHPRVVGLRGHARAGPLYDELVRLAERRHPMRALIFTPSLIPNPKKTLANQYADFARPRFVYTNVRARGARSRGRHAIGGCPRRASNGDGEV
jgi:Leucine-rich repeat (LRR) protein